MSISQIAKKIKDSAANVSRKIAALEKKSLILSREEREEAKGGRPRKICFLTRRAQEIVRPYVETSNPNLVKAPISTLISLLEDRDLSPRTRAVAASILADEALSNSELVPRNPKIRDMFEQTVNNYSRIEEEIRKGTLSILSASLPHITQNKETATWFHNTIYKSLLRIVSDKTEPPRLREWAINMLSRTAKLSHNSALTTKTIDTLLDLYFENTDLSQTAEDELLQFETKFQNQIVEIIRQNAKNEQKRTVAEDLLQVLIKNWWSKDLSRAT
jgi:DNA-binding MarR family transcriptional regulator